MATIYTILGTDSISSSRLNINDNFDNLNTDLSAIDAFFDTDNQHLDLTGNVTAGGNAVVTGNISAGGTLSATGITSVVDLLNSGKVIKSGIATASATLPGAGGFTSSTYQVICATGSGNTDALENGEQGQEILIVCDPAATTGHKFVITHSSSNIKNVATSITLEAGEDTKDYVLLRYVTDVWVIISIGSGVVVA